MRYARSRALELGLHIANFAWKAARRSSAPTLARLAQGAEEAGIAR